MSICELIFHDQISTCRIVFIYKISRAVINFSINYESEIMDITVRNTIANTYEKRTNPRRISTYINIRFSRLVNVTIWLLIEWFRSV
jgi:hypothetical protein